jgi:hypothetical protein
MNARTLKIIVALCVLALASFTPGCVTNGAKPTAEAIKFNTLRSTWTIALATHDVYAEMVVLNKVKPADQADIDKAFEDFKSAFKVAALLAESNLAAPTPENLQKLADDLVTLIRSL